MTEPDGPGIIIARIIAAVVLAGSVYQLGKLAYVIGGLYPHMRPGEPDP